MPPTKRVSFYNPSKRLSFLQVTPNDDEAERAEHRAEADLEDRLSRLSVSQARASTGGDLSSSSNLPMVQLQDHFQICLKMFTANKINNQNVWQLDIFSYLQNMLNNENEELRSILQVAGTSLDIGSKIYSVRVDDMHSEVLKLANALSSLHMKENKKDQEHDDSETEEKESKTQKIKKMKRKCLDDLNTRITVVSNVEALQGSIKKYNLQSNQCSEVTDVNSLFNVTFPQKPDGSFQLMTPSQAKEIQWCEMGTQKFDNTNEIDSKLLHLEPFPKHLKICPTFANFAIDQWDLDDEIKAIANEGEEQPIMDEDGNYVAYLDPELDPEPEDETQFSTVGLAANNATNASVFITDMKPGKVLPDGTVLLDPSVCQPNISNRFQIIGKWVGPVHWKFKPVRKPEQKKSAAQAQTAKATTKQARKVKPYQPVELTIDQVKSMMVAAGKRTTKNSQNAVEKCTLAEYHEIMPEERLNMMSRSKVQAVRSSSSDTQTKCTDLDISSYDFDNLNDSEYCPTVPQNEWEVDNPKEDITEACIAQVTEEGQTEDNSFDLIDKPKNIVTGSFIPYATKAKKMDMKKLKDAIWDDIKHIMEDDVDDVPRKTTLTAVYSSLRSKLPKSMVENLTAALTFVALLHVANEKNLLIGNDDQSDIQISKFPNSEILD